MARKAKNPHDMQCGLFTTDQAPLHLPTCEEMQRDVKLTREHKAIGAFLSEHPVDPWKAKFAERVTHGCGDSHAMIEARVDIFVIGLVTDFDERGRIAWLKVEDETGECGVLCFSDEIERYRFALSKWDISAFSLAVRFDANRAPTLQLKKAHRLAKFNYSSKL